MQTLDVFYLVAVWFFILSLVSEDDRIYSAILFLFSLFNIMIFDLFDFASSFSYEDKKWLLIQLDGSLGLIMTLVMYKENKAMYQAIILIFMVLFHSMILLYIINDDSLFWWVVSTPFHAIYDESIIILALLQILVSRNGMVDGLIGVFRGIKTRFLRGYVYLRHSIQSCYIYFKQKKSEKRT